MSEITTFITNDKTSANLVFNADNESIIMLATTEDLTYHRITKNKIEGVTFDEIKSITIQEHILYYAKIMFDLLKAGKDIEYINDFIEKEILSNNN